MVTSSDAYKVGTAAEIADMWGVSTQGVIMAILRGRLEARKSKNTWVIAFADAEKYFGRPASYYPSPESAKDSPN
jgi:hypothetical protein